MTGKPWLEEWRAEGRPTVVWSGSRRITHGDTAAIGALIAAAPAMARALCHHEWNHPLGRCAECGGSNPTLRGAGHKPDCLIDTALTAAGLDADARHEVRSRG